jgi:hypothetical protein
MSTISSVISSSETRNSLQKCIFIMNALENGWSVKKRRGAYVFSKKHEGRREILREGYLARFLEENMEGSMATGLN